MKTHIKKLGVFVVLFVIGLANALAEEITVTFLPGTTKSNNYKQNADTITLDGVTITCSSASFANEDTYRFYGGSQTTFSVDKGTLNKVVIYHPKTQNYPPFDKKTLSSGSYSIDNYVATWTGNVKSFTVKANSQVRATQIDVTYSIKRDGTEDNPYTIADVITLGANGVTGSDVYVKGVVNEVRSTAENIEDEKSCNYSVADVVGDGQTLDVYGGKYLNKADIISAEQIATGDQVVLCGKLELVDEKSVRLAQGTYIDHFWGNELTLDEERTSNTVENLRHATVTLHRTFNANAWNSLVLPFDITEERADQIFGSDACFANFTGTHLNSDDTYTLVFEMTESISANTPVFVYGASNVDNTVIEDVQVVSETASVTPDNAAFTFMGSYDAMTLKAQDWFISSDNNFYRANGNETMKATRAVFRPLTSATGTSNLRFHLGERPTGIKVVGVGNTASHKAPECYNLMGQTVADNYHGIVIVNGKKYVNR